MNRNHHNMDNDRFGRGYQQMNRGFQNDRQQQQQQQYDDDDRHGSQRSFGGYDDNRMGRGGSQRSFGGYDDNRFTGNQGSFDQGNRQNDRYRMDRGQGRHDEDYGYGDRSSRRFEDERYSRYGEEHHDNDEHERGRWGSDYEGRRGHRYYGGMIDDGDQFRRDEARFQRSGYQSHGVYDRNRNEGFHRQRGQHDNMRAYGGDRGDRYGGDRYGGQRRFGGDRDFDARESRGTFQGSRHDYDLGERGRYPYDGRYERGGYGRDQRDDFRGRGSDNDMRHYRDRDDDNDRRWVGGGFEEDRRGRRW